QATRNIRTTPKRDDRDIVLRRCPYCHEHIVLVFGINHQVRSALSHTPPHTKQVAETLAVGMDQALVTTIADLIGAHPQSQLSQKAVMTNWLGQPGGFDRHGRRV